jgi:hypothetical protein
MFSLAKEIMVRLRKHTEGRVRPSTNSSVLLPWVEALPWKQQSILFSGLRGPDAVFLTATKQVSKWIRSVSQQNADPSKSYMNDIILPTPSELEKELEQLPCHFVHHLADALAVIAYGHPEDEVRRYAYGLHAYIAEELFHFLPEPPEIFRWRHRDRPQVIDPQAHAPYDDRPWMHALLPDGYEHR